MRKQGLRDQVAIVTGASSGIGQATALALAREGAHIALAARRAQALSQVAGEIEGMGAQALAVPTDVADRSQVDALVRATLSRWGRVDILVANAGMYVRAPVTPTVVEDIEQAMAVNFYGSLFCVLAVLPHLIAQRSGHLVFVNTMDAKSPIPPDAPYVSSKCALAGFAQVLRQELHDSGVSVTTIFPGRVDTPMIGNIRVPSISKKIPAEAVARAIVDSVYRRPPEIVIPRGAWALVLLNVFFPRLADRAVRLFHLQGWETPAEPSHIHASNGGSR